MVTKLDIDFLNFSDNSNQSYKSFISLKKMSSNTKLVLKYLKDNDYLQSFLTLQRQTGVSLTVYSKEIEFFKKIVLKGDFNQAVVFLQTFQNRIEQGQFKSIMLQIYRQKLLELIENPNQQQLKNLFEKELVAYCAQEQFQEMFSYLTYRSVNQIQGLEKWSIIRGRYYCFQSIVPILDMFNSTMKHDQTEDKLEDIIEFYNKNKFNQSEPFSFNRNNQILHLQQQEVKNNNFTKNKSSIPQIFNKSNQFNNQEEDEPEIMSNLSQNRDKQKEIIKNSVINMNISGNYSQMKSKLSNNAGMIQKKPSKTQEENETIIEKNKSNFSMVGKSQLNLQKSQFPQDKNSQFMQKSQTINKNPINLQKSQQVGDKKISSSIIQKSDIMNQKRPRTNANLKGTTQKQRIQGSIKMDNFMKNQSSVSVEDNFNLSNAYRNPKIQKSQMINSNINNYSQFNKSKVQNKSSYNKLQENPLAYSHMNDYQSSHLNEITEEDNSEATKSIKNQKQKYSYLREKDEDEDLSEEVKKNVEYLQQSNSVIWNNSELSNQNFAMGGEQDQKHQKIEIKNITKLGTTSDSKAIRTCQFSQSGNYFAVGTNSSILKIFDVQNLFAKNKFQEIIPIYQIDGLHTKSIFCLDWSKNERNLVTCSNDLNVKITEISKNFTQHKTSIIGKHDSCIRMAKFSPSESKIISCGDDSLIKVWDTGKVKKCLNLKSHTNSVSAFKIQNQNQLFSVSKDMTIKKWDLRNGDNIFTSKIQESQLTYIANNTDKIIVSHKNGNISFFTPTLDLIHAVQIHQEQIRSIQALKGENLLLTASFDGHVALFNEHNNHQPHYWQHNENGDDKVVFATFLHSSHFQGFSSTSTQGLCHIYSYQ